MTKEQINDSPKNPHSFPFVLSPKLPALLSHHGTCQGVCQAGARGDGAELIAGNHIFFKVYNPMIPINILTPQMPHKRGFNDFYPLIKWEKEFKNEGIKFKFINSEKTAGLNCDILLIDYRYFHRGSNNWEENKLDAISFIEGIQRHNLKIIWFDPGDSSGSRGFKITPYVNIHLKKQLLKNREEYTINRGDKSVMCWIPEEHTPSKIPYTACRKEDLEKLKLSWNIGLTDFRYFPFSQYYPFGTSIFLNRFYKKPSLFSPKSSFKDVLTSYRGSINTDTRYSFQRALVLETTKNLFEKGYKVGYGGKLTKRAYLDEMKRSKAVISPFGWGEICYRDFEAFINGSIQIKPSVEHLETFPNYFIKNETYLPISWNLDDLKSVLENIADNYEKYMHIAENGQRQFIESVIDFNSFKTHFFRNVIES